MDPLNSQPNEKRDRGFVLVLVLWSVILLALMAAGFSASVRAYLRSVTTDKEIVRAEAAADGGINLALMDLATSRKKDVSQSRFAADGSTAACQMPDGGVIAIRIEDEAGKVNLNLANAALLETVFAGAGASADQASAYAAAVLDFRDGDADRRPNGAERDDYVTAGVLARPKDGPFDTVDELDQVLSLPPEFLDQLKPYATVHSGLSGIDLTLAAPGLRAIFEAAPLQSATGGIDGGGQRAEFAARSNDRAYTIHALARLSSGVQYASKAIVEFPERFQQRYQLRQWRRGSARDVLGGFSLDETALPPC